MNTKSEYDAMFSTVIGQDYDMLQLICPAATEMSRLVGVAVGAYQTAEARVQITELGGGTGITTLAILAARQTAQVYSVDNEPVMQNQAKQRLQRWQDEGRLSFSGDDALTALVQLPDNSQDIVASAYTLHNFSGAYRQHVLQEIFRVLKPHGQFINGDRYALDDIVEHTRTVQEEISHYFKVLAPLNRIDLLEQWLVHLFNDESENHIMRLAVAKQQMQAAGFADIQEHHRHAVNALVTAVKPWVV